MGYMTNKTDFSQDGSTASNGLDLSSAFTVTTHNNGTDTSGFYIGETVSADFDLDYTKLGYLSETSVPFGFYVEQCQVWSTF